jgi:hypothetical protein
VAAATLAQGQPELLATTREAFMAGMHAGSLLVAVVCLVGAVAAAVALPGRGFSRESARGGDSLVAIAPEPA